MERKSLLFFTLMVYSVTIKAYDLNQDTVKISELPVPTYEPSKDSDTPSPRIIGGQNALPGQFPYQVALLGQTEQGTFFCGGSLISEQCVLTAAHCVQGISNMTILLGTIHIKQKEETQVRLESKDFVIHPNYDASKIINDIALVKLPEKVKTNDNINIVRLPSRSQIKESFNNQEATISGWGRTSDSSNEISPDLKFTSVRTMGNLGCSIWYLGGARDTNICSHGLNNKKTCNGDSGGPMVFDEKDGECTQIGIVSFGIKLGCEKGWPSVFTRVTSYLDFIAENSDVKIRE